MKNIDLFTAADADWTTYLLPAHLSNWLAMVLHNVGNIYNSRSLNWAWQTDTMYEFQNLASVTLF